MHADDRIARASDNVQRVADAKESVLLDEIIALHREKIALSEECAELRSALALAQRQLRMVKIIQKGDK